MNYDTADGMDKLIFSGRSNNESKVGDHVKIYVDFFVIYSLHQTFWEVESAYDLYLYVIFKSEVHSFLWLGDHQFPQLPCGPAVSD